MISVLKKKKKGISSLKKKKKSVSERWIPRLVFKFCIFPFFFIIIFYFLSASCTFYGT